MLAFEHERQRMLGHHIGITNHHATDDQLQHVTDNHLNRI